MSTAMSLGRVSVCSGIRRSLATEAQAPKKKTKPVIKPLPHPAIPPLSTRSKKERQVMVHETISSKEAADKYRSLSNRLLKTVKKMSELNSKDNAPFPRTAPKTLSELLKFRKEVTTKKATETKRDGPVKKVDNFQGMAKILVADSKALTSREALDDLRAGSSFASNQPVLEDLKPIAQQRPVAQLVHGLDRVLFNPGVHWTQDPRSGVYNFPPQVQVIPKVSDFAFERLPGFTKSSRDEELWQLAAQYDKPFAGSTSSLSGMLCHIYFMISRNRDVYLNHMTKNFNRSRAAFTPGQRMPATVVFNYKDGRYAIDSYGDLESEKNILTWMGTLLEKYLTTERDEFSNFMRTETTEKAPQEENPLRDAFRFSQSNTFVMRSQLDCQDHRLPGTGVFDLKTRASSSIRMDILNFEANSGYLIDRLYGLERSFEKEYYDLIRSAFLKYSFQVRIGNMDGVMVAYHNTEQMFGFQYIPLEEMDLCLFGPGEGRGERVFGHCIKVMEAVAQAAVECFPKQSIRCMFEAEEVDGRLHVWVEPEHWTSDEPRPIQELVVSVEHYVNGKRQGPKTALELASDTKSWEVRHFIGRRPSAEIMNIRRDYMLAKERNFRPFALPDGVKLETVVDFWKGLNFGGKPVEDQSVPDDEYFASKFAEPDGLIIALRQAAKEGRQETERRKRVEKGLPIFVLGEPFDPEEARLRKIRLQAQEEEDERALREAEEARLQKYTQEGEWEPFDVDGNKAEVDATTAHKPREVPKVKLGFDTPSTEKHVTPPPSEVEKTDTEPAQPQDTSFTEV